MPAISNEVPIGKRMKGAEMLSIIASVPIPKFVLDRRDRFHELRQAMGTSKPIIPVPFSVWRSWLEFAADGAGTSGSAHSQKSGVVPFLAHERPLPQPFPAVRPSEKSDTSCWPAAYRFRGGLRTKRPVLSF